QRTLAIVFQAATNTVQVSWPVSAVSFVLQFNTNLVSVNNLWFDVGTAPTTVTNQSTVYNVVTENAAPPRRFYRLRSP
ncbi:MAG: hypothetical protein HY300_01670, partial [Verrucomicrobia bacterium]|nr:hypothetical protein [Verrucomicrobiota bacterium]